MKKILFICSIMLMGFLASANAEQAIDVSQISKVTFDGDNVIVFYKSGSTSSETFDMSEIVLDFSNVTAVERVEAAKPFGIANKTIYNMQGQAVGDDISALKSGLYIVEGKKIIIK